MKLAYHNLIDTFSLDACSISTLVIENRKLFREFIDDLYHQINNNGEKFILSENNKTINIAQCVELVIDPIALEINTRKIQTKLFEQLNKIAVNEDYILDTLEVKRFILAYAYKLLHSESLPLTLDDDFKLTDIFKALDIKFESCPENLPMHLANYIDIHRNYLNIKVLVLVNIKAYITDEELLLLFKQASMRNLSLLLIENSIQNTIKGECVTIIDKDLCIVRKEF